MSISRMKMLQVSKCLIGLAVMVLQSCDVAENRRDLLCGNWESVEGKPDVLIYKEGEAYKVTVFKRSGIRRKLKPETYLLQEENGNLFMNTGFRIDDNFTVEELGAIAFGYTKLLEESNDVLTELKNVVNITTLSMTDKERMDVVERCHSKMKRYRNLVSYYTNKNISVSYLRAKKKNDLDRIMGLYGSMNERYW